MHNFKGASEEHINDYDYEYYYYDDDDGDVASERNFPTFTQGGSFADVPQNIQDSLRRLLCPLCVARRFAFNTLSVRHFALLFHSTFLTHSVIFFAGDIRLHILESHAVHLGCELGVGRAGRIGGEEEGTALRCYYAKS